jgi:phage host-nuclease inhibitor protein Gam
METTTTLTEDNGWIIDENGEIIEAVAPTTDFIIDSKERMDWFLEKRLQAVSEVAAADATVKRAEAMKKRAQSRVDALDRRFSAEATEFARKNMPDKGKTYYSIFGEVAFRSTPAKLKVVNEEAAIEWANTHGLPECIKTVTTFQISRVPKQKADNLSIDQGFDWVPAGESVSIKTDVKA